MFSEFLQGVDGNELDPVGSHLCSQAGFRHFQGYHSIYQAL